MITVVDTGCRDDVQQTEGREAEEDIFHEDFVRETKQLGNMLHRTGRYFDRWNKPRTPFAPDDYDPDAKANAMPQFVALVGSQASDTLPSKKTYGILFSAHRL